MGTLRTLTDLMLPRGCAGCDLPDATLCDGCLALMRGDGCRVLRVGEGRCTVWSCAAYRGPVRRALLAWKDHGDERLDAVFADLLASLACRHADEGTGRMVLVPAPSSPASARRRGRRHMVALCRAVRRRLERRGRTAVCADLLRVDGVRARSVQTGGVSARAERLRGRTVALPRAREHRGGSVILVDDILTTGATLRAGALALASAGVAVPVALTLAEAPPPAGTPELSGPTAA